MRFERPVVADNDSCPLSVEREQQMTVQHIVLFRFTPALDESLHKELRRRVAAWSHLIPEVGGLRLGTDMSGARNEGYQYLLYTEFDDSEGLNAYQRHPVQEKFLKWAAEHGGQTLAFDYELNEETVLSDF
jgi:stress responsive alpha/beta barrel protein